MIVSHGLLHDFVTSDDGPDPADAAPGGEHLDESNAEVTLAGAVATVTLDAAGNPGSESWLTDVEEEDNNSNGEVVDLDNSLIHAAFSVFHFPRILII